ncbi:hypothetical protein Desku_1063 [Desulfofundulus kuznetsovii DSM 6115]|uniref:Uncharacterized protein n=1 Tax=Desulfofundulus kuznetsovii (strain DSM 6115 / VKM B-1805 / 17) TaxID=760568 RepID=A0AAU8PP47_DESK7|nr:hypothetical protein Desku_1063 [Desulfofundulus kuznetsovii DSM 6115]
MLETTVLSCGTELLAGLVTTELSGSALGGISGDIAKSSGLCCVLANVITPSAGSSEAGGAKLFASLTVLAGKGLITLGISAKSCLSHTVLHGVTACGLSELTLGLNCGTNLLGHTAQAIQILLHLAGEKSEAL